VTLGHKWLHGPLATGGFWVRDLALFGPTRLGWRSRLELPTGSREYNPNATRFEAGTVDAAAFVGLRQTLVVHRQLGSWVSERVGALRRRLLEKIGELPFILRSTPEGPTGIVVVEPRGGDVAALVQRMWDEERIVVKLINEPGIPQAIRLSFWALHNEKDIDRLALAFSRTFAVGVR
jgi:selenocysteine lyase/cysteine desulfurase